MKTICFLSTLFRLANAVGNARRSGDEEELAAAEDALHAYERQFRNADQIITDM